MELYAPHLVEFDFGTESESVDGVSSDIGPLSEFLRRFGECHVRCDGGIDDSLCSFDGNDSVETARRVEKERHVDGRRRRRQP